MAIRLCWAVKGSEGAKPKGRYLERTRGRRRVPHETQGSPKCQMRTTFRRTSETSNRKSSIEQKSCAAENRVETVVDAEPSRDHAFGPVPVAAENFREVPKDSFGQSRGDVGLG